MTGIQTTWATKSSRDQGLNRRTILAGAAWSVPVIAVATASPAFAATTACPNVSSASSWTRGNNGYTDNGFIYERDGRQTFAVTSDNRAAKNSGYIARAWMTAEIQVTEGQTLSLSYEAFGNYSSYSKTNAAPAVANWNVDNSSISSIYGTQTDRYGTTQLPIKQSPSSSDPWRTYSASYKATKTGTVRLTWSVSLYDQQGTESGNDDIFVTLPTITCS